MSTSDLLLARFLALHPKLIDLSLGRILRLLERLGDPQKKLLQDMALWLDEEWPKWRESEDAAEDKIQKDAGVQYVDLGAWFSKRAHDAYWADLEKKSPQHIPHLRKLVTNP